MPVTAGSWGGQHIVYEHQAGLWPRTLLSTSGRDCSSDAAGATLQPYTKALGISDQVKRLRSKKTSHHPGYHCSQANALLW